MPTKVQGTRVTQADVAVYGGSSMPTHIPKPKKPKKKK